MVETDIEDVKILFIEHLNYWLMLTYDVEVSR
jgi:hypothetical protein